MFGRGDARVVVIVLAGGAGERLGGAEPKAFLEIGGRSILVVAAESPAECSLVDGLVVTAPDGLEDRAAAELGGLGTPVTVVGGGETRHDSVRAGLDAIPPGCSIVVCHDAARPLARPELFSSVIRTLERAPADVGGVIPGLPLSDTIKRVRAGEVVGTEPREGLIAAQTPQAFRTHALLEAHRRAAKSGRVFSDDAGAIEWAGGRIQVVPGDPDNFKITTDADLRRANERLFGANRG